MRSNVLLLSGLMLVLLALNTGMGRHSSQYDVEAREAEKASKRKVHAENPASGIAEGVKTATVDSTTGLVSETAEGAAEEGPVTGTLEGTRRGTGAVLDKTVKGAVKIATLGQGDVNTFDVQEPEANSGEPTKIKIRIPGT